MRRRDVISGAATLVAGAAAGACAHSAVPQSTQIQGGRISAVEFGAKGDGIADDTAALQAALNATMAAGRPGLLVIPPGTYKVSKGLTVDMDLERGRQTRWTGISAHGAQFRSSISDGSDVLTITSKTVARFILIEGLDIRGRGSEGSGLSIACDGQGHYFYNAALRDVVVEGCGGDGCRMIGNIFESQIINSYFRDNRGNGVTMAHGTRGGILSAIHVFGCVFGGNRQHGVALLRAANDVSFFGCYFLLNDRFGLYAANGCPLLSHCGFENNHRSAPNFASGGAGMKLNVFGTLIGCTAYSIFNQTHLIDAFITNRLVMIGCTASGGERAKGAKLARLDGKRNAEITLIGCYGGADQNERIEAFELGQRRGGARFGSQWDGHNHLRLGDHTLWIDRNGQLRMKRGDPSSDTDGRPVGS